ncbi:MAG: bifunctional DNA primase/polymerase [Desulfobacterales bacterium]|nr:bifunctional DNA primase/polymerase [Desulfobacterales bacterium]
MLPKNILNKLTEEQYKSLEIYQELSRYFSLIPLHYKSKVPKETEWTKWCIQKREFKLEDFISISKKNRINILNAGVACGSASKVIVVDIDDEIKFTQWCKEKNITNPLPQTLTVRSGGKSKHYYYQYPDDNNVYGKKNIKGIFDALGIGGQAVAPGSIHPKTCQMYEVIDDRNIAPSPTWVLDLIIKTDEVKLTNNNPVTDNPVNITDNKTHILVVKRSLNNKIEQGERNSKLLSLAGTMLRKGMSFESIEAALLAENQQRCNPPLTDEEVKKTAKGIMRYSNSNTTRKKYNLTEYGNAERLVDKFGDNIRYCPQMKNWLIWDGKRWKMDKLNKITALAKETIREIYIEASAIEDEKDRKTLISHALQSEKASSLENMIKLATSEPTVVISQEQLNSNPMLLNCVNGTIDLKTGELKSHNKFDYITKVIPVDYNQSAKCPVFDKFIHQIMNNNLNLIDYLCRIFGYTLTGNMKEQCYFIFFGDGSNGKSTMLNIFRKLLGGYAKCIDFNTIAYDGDKTRTDLARLVGSRLVISSEIDFKRAVNETVVNRITGQDALTVRFLYGKDFEYNPEFKLFVSGNHKPNIKGTKHATWRRIKLIPFNVKFEDKEQDKELFSKLSSELAGILAWAVRGCLSWQESGLNPPQEVQDAVKNYREETDTLGKFMSDCCIINFSESIKSSDFYKRYVLWCDENGETITGKKQFTTELIERGYKKIKSSGFEHWHGLSLRTDICADNNTPVVDTIKASSLL